MDLLGFPVSGPGVGSGPDTFSPGLVGLIFWRP